MPQRPRLSPSSLLDLALAGGPLLALVTILGFVGRWHSWPVILLAVLGLGLLLREGRTLWRDPAHRLLWLLFLCLWLPMLASLPGAVRQDVSLPVALAYLHFPLAATFLVEGLRRGRARWILPWGLLLAVLAWSGDGILQFFQGEDLFGYPRLNSLITGIFHPYQRIGLMTAVLAPILFSVLEGAVIRRRGLLRWLLVLPALAAVAVILAVIVLSNKVGAWFMISVGLFLYLAHALRRARLQGVGLARARGVSIIALVLVLVAATGVLTTDEYTLGVRKTQIARLFRYDFEEFDLGSGHRASIWQVAADMVPDHLATGIGPRGFRHAYKDYVRPDNFWLQSGWIKPGEDGPNHPHLMGLEILVETGLVGVGGYVLFWLIFAYHVRRHPPPEEAWGWLVSCFVTFFFLNWHMAFYGNNWSGVSWWILGGALAALAPARKEAPGVSGAPKAGGA